MPDEEHLVNKIPSEQFTSDHLALIADFDWCSVELGQASNLVFVPGSDSEKCGSENNSWFERLKNIFKT